MSEISWQLDCSTLDSNRFTFYLANDAQLLDKLGRIIFGNQLFDLIGYIRIDRMEGRSEPLGDCYPSDPEKEAKWILKRLQNDGEITTRVLEYDFELFAMLVAEIRLGARVLEVRHATNALNT